MVIKLSRRMLAGTIFVENKPLKIKNNMLITCLQIIFYGLIPLGIYLLIKTIGMLKKTLSGTVIAEFSFTQKETVFAIQRQGTYAIWQQGKLFKRTLLGKFDLRLTKESPAVEIALSASVFSPHVNGFDTGRIEWKRFDADSGNYKLEVKARANPAFSERILDSIASPRAIDYSQYILQIRESLPAYYVVISIPLIMISLGLIFGGPVLAINAADVAKGVGLI